MFFLKASLLGSVWVDKEDPIDDGGGCGDRSPLAEHHKGEGGRQEVIEVSGRSLVVEDGSTSSLASSLRQARKR